MKLRMTRARVCTYVHEQKRPTTQGSIKSVSNHKKTQFNVQM